MAAPEPARPRSLADWLRSRSDEQLSELLRRRPDLAVPAPHDFATLASRISVRTSVQRALDQLNRSALRTVEAMALGWVDLLDEADADYDGLRRLGLAWGEDDPPTLVGGVAELLGPYPAGLGRPLTVLLAGTAPVWRDAVARTLGVAGQDLAGAIGGRLDELVAGADEDEQAVLDALAAGPPVHPLPHAMAPLADPARGEPARRLAMRGLLVPVDSGVVELPREVGLALRGARPLGNPRVQAPEVACVPREVDALGTTAVLAFLRLVDALAASWGATPAPMLRSGGLGVRELRRTTRELGVDEPVACLLIEVAYDAGLINVTSGLEPVYLPTPEYDSWRAQEPAERWTPLALAWLAMTRQPSLVGQRGDRDRMISALSPDVERGTLPALRAAVLGVLASLPPGSVPAAREDVLARLAWLAPRRASAQRGIAAAVLDEADLLGVTAAGGLTGYGRAVLAGLPASASEAVAAALPAPVDEILVQPDLTVVVPGPPTPALAARLELVADLESTGGASVYRITEASVRRALDRGVSAEELRALFTERSRTPVPQALTYLIEDAARRHGVLRSGPASSYLRSDDEALLAAVLSAKAVARLQLARIAPSVLVSPLPVAAVLDGLRAAGFAPAAESPDGSVLSLAQDAPRAPSRNAGRVVRPRAAHETAGHLADVVRRLRAGDALHTAVTRPMAVPPVAGVTTAATLQTLRDAVRNSRMVAVRYLDLDGSPADATVVPISLGGGVLRGHERGTRQLRAFQLHRLMAVSVLPDEDE